MAISAAGSEELSICRKGRIDHVLFVIQWCSEGLIGSNFQGSIVALSCRVMCFKAPLKTPEFLTPEFLTRF
jgi:hypothetical protein